MRIAFIYPPPWKIGEPNAYGSEGPPPEYQDGDLDGDFFQTPYGLYSLAAQATEAGHQVKLLNLSGFRWNQVEDVIRRLDADLFAMSCWTANRRGVVYAANAIKAAHPKAHLVVGGPHASPLASDMLAHYPTIDTICEGESEQTLLELIERLSQGQDNIGLAGAWYRQAGQVVKGPPRGNMPDLDTLASVHRYFDTHIFMTSRGCPWACTFCGAESQWGRGFRGNSVDYVLDALEAAVSRLPVKMLLIKDDTFTTNKKRVIELCRGIRARGLKFLWSCDTRVDLLTDELLYEMRLAGCQRLSLGVESGAPEILAQVDKKITVDDIVRSTDLAKKYGIKVRYYMMLGNRGETTETFEQTLKFLKRAKPHHFIFSCLSIYPGTRDFIDAEKQGWLDRRVFFDEPFQELKVPFDATEADTTNMIDWFSKNSGLQAGYEEGVNEYTAILGELPEHAPAHLDLAGAQFQAGDFDACEKHARLALKFGHPLPALALNYLACVAVKRNDYDSMMDHYTEASRLDPQHLVVMKNVQRARAWFKRQGPAKGEALELEAHHQFQLFERTAQPVLPGMLPDDFDNWDKCITPRPAGPSQRETQARLESGDGAAVARLGSNAPLRTKRHLNLVDK